MQKVAFFEWLLFHHYAEVSGSPVVSHTEERSPDVWRGKRNRVGEGAVWEQNCWERNIR